MTGSNRHLSPGFPTTVPRHGSLPNVNAVMGLQVKSDVVVIVFSSHCFKENK
jgi:hypothetical protein